MARNAPPVTSDRRRAADGDVEPNALETALDEALAETFPASDPVAIHVDAVASVPDRALVTAAQRELSARQPDRRNRRSKRVNRSR